MIHDKVNIYKFSGMVRYEDVNSAILFELLQYGYSMHCRDALLKKHLDLDVIIQPHSSCGTTAVGSNGG